MDTEFKGKINKTLTDFSGETINDPALSSRDPNIQAAVNSLP